MKKFLFILFWILIITPFSSAARSKGVPEMKYYIIDPAQSEFMVHTDTGGLLGGMGHKLNIAIQEFSGQIKIPSYKLQSASLQIKVKPQSLTVTDKVEEKDKAEIEDNMQKKVLDIQKFPEIIFVSRDVNGKQVTEGLLEVKITGDLTLHGITKPVEIPTQVSIKQNQLTATGEFSIKQTDFKIKPFSAMGGTLKVKNSLRLTFNLQAHFQK
jgi:polyisoprenoid-binding protein YceI